MNLEEYCVITLVNFKDRLNFYLNSNYEDILARYTPIASKIIQELSPYAVFISAPIVEALSKTKQGNAMISLVFNVILAGLLFLSGYVIYNIMRIIVDAKVYDAAVLRTLGMTKLSMLHMMTMYALIKGIMSIIFGFAFSSLLIGSVNEYV